MSFKFDKMATNSLDGNEATGSTSNLSILRDERRQNKSINLERPFESRGFRIFYFILSTLALISGIVCLIVASQIRGEYQDTKAHANKQAYLGVGNGTNEVGNGTNETGKLRLLKVFTAPLPSSINVSFASGPGHVFTFRGFTTNSDRWIINFMGKNGISEKHIHFHFNPRPEENTIVRNAKTNGKWHIEDRALCFKEYPFKSGQRFEVKVIVEETKFVSYVDGVHYFDFSPALPNPSDIEYVTISGDVFMQNMTVYELINQ